MLTLDHDCTFFHLTICVIYETCEEHLGASMLSALLQNLTSSAMAIRHN